MLKDANEILAFRRDYEMHVSRGNKDEALFALKKVLGLKSTDDPIKHGFDLAPSELLWRMKSAEAQDLSSVLQRERIAAFQALQVYLATNLAGESRMKTVAALARLMFAEALPDAVRVLANLSPIDFDRKLRLKDFERARKGFEVMMQDKLNVSEIFVPSLGITRNQLGLLIEESWRVVASGGF